MSVKTISPYAVVAGTLFIWCIKFFVRPYVPVPFYIQPLVDVAPNLIGSFLIPFAACWLFGRFFPLDTIQRLRTTCLTGLLLVVINEYLQLIPFFGRTFDYLDILSSFVGVFLGQQVFGRVMSRSFRHNRDQVV